MKNSVMLSSAAALVTFGTGGEAAAVTALRMKATGMFQISKECEATPAPAKCCEFDDMLEVLGSNSLTPGAFYYEPSRVMDNGIQVAINEINDNCGIEIEGKKYALRYKRVDDRSDPDTARHIAAQHLGIALDKNGSVTNAPPAPLNTAFYVAPYGTSQCEKVNPVVADSGKASIAPGCSSQSVYTNIDNVFGVRVPASELMIPSIDAYASLGVKSVVSVVEDSGFPKAVCSPVKAHLEANHGLNISFISETPLKTENKATELEIDNMVKDWKAKGAEMVIGCTYEDLCVRIIKSMIAHDFDPKAMAFTECVGVESVTKALGNKLVGVSGSSPFPTLAQGDAWKEKHEAFTAAYKLMTGEGDVPVQAAASYAGVKIMANAIEAVGSTNGTLVAAHLYSHDMPTAFGDFSFDSTGQPKNKATVMQYDSKMSVKAVGSTHVPLFPKPKWATLDDGTDSTTDSNTGTGGVNGDGDTGTGGVKDDGNTGTGPNAFSGGTIKLESKLESPGQHDYTSAIVGSVVGGLFMFGAMLIAAVFAYAWLFRRNRQHDDIN